MASQTVCLRRRDDTVTGVGLPVAVDGGMTVSLRLFCSTLFSENIVTLNLVGYHLVKYSVTLCKT